MSDSDRAENFETVRRKEREEIGLKDTEDAVGLAFSGGGIRSATFCLGILQGLAQLGLLNRFHFLSTVSGGGYIGSWLSSWIHRTDWSSVQTALAEENDEPKQVRFLREYSNYLTPRRGLLGDDSWTALATYIRNLLLNLLLLLPVMAAVVLLPLAVVQFYGLALRLIEIPVPFTSYRVPLTLVFAAAILTSTHIIVVANIAKLRAPSKGKASRWTQSFTIKFFVAFFVLVSAFFISVWLKKAPELRWWEMVTRGTATYFGIFVAGLMIYIWLTGTKDVTSKTVKRFGLIGASSAVAGAVAAYLIWALNQMMQGEYWGPEARALLGTPLIVLALVVASMVRTGVAGPELGNNTREWWARVGAVVLKWTAIFAALSVISFYGPQIVHDLRGDVAFTATFSWIASTALGVFAGTRGESKSAMGKRLLGVLAWLTPVIFIVGILLGIAVAIDAVQSGMDFRLEWLILIGPAFGFGLSWLISVNEFSMHAFYRNRLVRAYLGASRGDGNGQDEREAHAFTGFDPRDDEPLSEIWKKNVTNERTAPYHLINTTLNLVHGKRLAWQQRKAASFVLAPLYCGYELPRQLDGEDIFGFRQTRGIGEDKPTAFGANMTKSAIREMPYERERKLTIGTAFATSGAAVSPNMGFYSSAPLAFLMTILNVRLGWWLGNPRHCDSWNRLSPRFGFLNLMAELLSLTSDRNRYVYLSDGGHFENLGIYELVRRRCRYIVACDAAGDPDLEFSDLGNAIEKCRTDFGVEIDINLEPLEKKQTSKWHSVVGTIRYPATGETTEPCLPPFTGTLVYLKPTLTGDEPVDIKRYAVKHPEFPHQSTADQWFDEAQFESYRKLGEHTAQKVFGAIGDRAELGQRTDEQLFADLRRYFCAPAPTNAESFSTLANDLDAIWSDMRSDPHLRFLDDQIYGEWRRLLEGVKNPKPPEANFWLPASQKERRSGFFMCQRMIQLMEKVYVDLNLEEYWDHPDNRGWINLFNHWVYSGMFRITWAVTASSYGARFQAFCERRLALVWGIQVRLGKSDPVSEDLKEGREPAYLTFLEKERLTHCLAVYRELKMPQDPSTLTVFPIDVVVSDHYGSKTKGNEFRFSAGFALVDVQPQEGSKGRSRLMYFRIQNHLRQHGLGGEATKRLCETEDDLGSKEVAPGVEKILKIDREKKLGEPKLQKWYEQHLSETKMRQMEELVRSAKNAIESKAQF